MGRIKSTMIKKAAKELMEAKDHKFNSSYDHNKELLKGTMPSKKIRNKVAGHITRKEKAKKKEKK